jgi:thioredoxin reductase (NADPH)
LFDLIIIGAGPAGLAAAIYGLRAGAETLLIEREACGGKMNLTKEIANYPGYGKIEGIELSERMLDDVKSLGAQTEYGEVINSSLLQTIKSVYTKKEEFIAPSIIIAAGLKTLYLNCPGEARLKGRGVSYCAVCDGFFFKNKSAAVIGGGNTALEDAIYLSDICSDVKIIVRKNYFRGEEFLINSANKRDNINVLFETQVVEIKGDKKVNSVILNQKGEEKEVYLDAVFIAIGQRPDNKAFFEVKTDKSGFIESDETCRTNIEGVFAAGDCRTKDLRQIITAASDGAVSAVNAVKYLKKHKLFHASAIRLNSLQ